MRKSNLFAALALLVGSGVPAAADGTVSMKDKPAPVTPAWDVAFGAYGATDYIFRGISQSARWPSGGTYSEIRYNALPTVQLYVGNAIESIDYPNRAAAEVDTYAGIRPTFDKLALDFGAWYYWYPGGRLFNGAGPDGPNPNCTNGFKINGSCNIYEADLSYWEAYAKGTYTINDIFTIGGNVYYSPSWLNEGADGTYASGTLKATFPATWTNILPNFIPKDTGAYISGEFGHYWFGQTNAFYGNIDLPEYSTWNAGITFTWKVFSLDLRYWDTDLSKADCNVLTADHTATFNANNITPTNPSGLGSNWCGSAFVLKSSFDLTVNNNLK